MSTAACLSECCSEVLTPEALPEDLDQCHVIIREKEEIILESRQILRTQEYLLREKEELIAALSNDLKLSKEQIEYLRRKLFGRRSEKITIGEGQLTQL